MGSYETETLTATEAGTTTDLLEAGGLLELTLLPGGVTSGHADLSHGDTTLDVDLEGTWTFDAGTSTVLLSHEADTFLRDMPLNASEVQGQVILEGSEQFVGVTIHLLLVNSSGS